MAKATSPKHYLGGEGVACFLSLDLERRKKYLQLNTGPK